MAIVGPMSSGKTTLLEAILARTGAISRQNSVGQGNTVGDHSAEARAHGMSVEASFATTEFMGDSITFADCPGSVEFAYEADPILALCDVAVVVAEADDKKLPALQLMLKRLDNHGIPRILFLNKIDQATAGVRDTLAMLQQASETPLLLRQIPIWKDEAPIGSIDLALERAYIYRQHEESEIVETPDAEKDRQGDARFTMLETLADHDDELMEQLLEDIEPERETVFADLRNDLQEGHVTPVLIGAAEKGNGVLRLLKAIRHDAPDVTATRARHGIDGASGFLGGVMKTIHTTHSGKLSVTRVLAGEVPDGASIFVGDEANRISGLYRMMGKDTEKLDKAVEGATVALGKLEHAVTGSVLSSEKDASAQLSVSEPPQPVYSMGARAKERRDEVKLSAALHRLVEEDPSLSIEHVQETAETVLRGHGEMHLRVAIERLEGKSQIAVEGHQPSIPYRETITRSTTQRGRHKKQSGGHGQFGDVIIEIKPLPRDSGFEFTETVTGGVVPRQYIPSVEHGIRDYLKSGPLGFPVVDVAVNLSDGSHHSVDSSDMAFQMAGKLAMREGMPECRPVLLEPIMKVRIHTPNEATAKVTAMIPQRRGQILGFDAREGWSGWDTVEALAPMSDIGDMIIELRSVTSGVASYSAAYDHMEKLEGRKADELVAARAAQNDG